MAQARILAPWAGEGNRSASYHCTSWVLDRAFRFGAEEKEKFAEMMRLYADFCGVRILSYCIMNNHFHILAEVPAAPEGGVGDDWLLEKLAMIRPQEFVDAIREQLESLGGTNATEEDLKAYEELRQQYFRRMLDLGEFMKTLKQSFSRWFNKKHKRRGTLWEECYSSVRVEEGYATMVTSAYIDLN